jgi:hypothetical protein
MMMKRKKINAFKLGLMHSSLNQYSFKMSWQYLNSSLEISIIID